MYYCIHCGRISLINRQKHHPHRSSTITLSVYVHWELNTSWFSLSLPVIIPLSPMFNSSWRARANSSSCVNTHNATSIIILLHVHTCTTKLNACANMLPLGECCHVMWNCCLCTLSYCVACTCNLILGIKGLSILVLPCICCHMVH